MCHHHFYCSYENKNPLLWLIEPDDAHVKIQNSLVDSGMPSSFYRSLETNPLLTGHVVPDYGHTLKPLELFCEKIKMELVIRR